MEQGGHHQHQRSSQGAPPPSRAPAPHLQIDVTAVVRVGPVRLVVPVSVANISFKATARIALQPLVEQLPCIGGWQPLPWPAWARATCCCAGALPRPPPAAPSNASAAAAAAAAGEDKRLARQSYLNTTPAMQAGQPIKKRLAQQPPSPPTQRISLSLAAPSLPDLCRPPSPSIHTQALPPTPQAASPSACWSRPTWTSRSRYFLGSTSWRCPPSRRPSGAPSWWVGRVAAAAGG
jgi:hypothetical protein